MKIALLFFVSLFAVSAKELDLFSRMEPLPLENRFAEDGYHVWCGAPVKGGDGKYHLFYSRWPEKATFAPGWALHSEIAYAVADKPQGPYRHVNVALGRRPLNPKTGKKYWDGDATHNANAFYYDGKYYLYYMGNYGDGKSYPVHRNNQRIGLAVASNPAGPWQRLDQPIVDVSSNPKDFDSLCVTNPAACMRPDGGVVLVYKAVQIIPGKEMGGNVRYGVAIASKPLAPYRKTKGKVFEAAPGSHHWMVAEDPFIWYSERYGARYYAVTRDVVGTFSGASGGLCLFESKDGLNWQASAHAKVLGLDYAMADGSRRRKIERPALLIEDDEPTYLFGAADGYPPRGRRSSNVQIPIRAQ